MKIAIISDIHNNEVNLKKVLDYCEKENIQMIICCGDLASMETLNFMNDNFSGEIYYTFGNMDNDQMTNVVCHPERSKGSRDSSATPQNDIKYKHTTIYNPLGEIEIDKKSLAFVHFPDVAKKLAETGKYDFVFYGHTHKPWEEMIGNCKMLNPGNVAGEIYPPTFAVWNTENDKFGLIRIHELK